MPVPLYTVDAFAATAFGGNPAAVCLLDEPRSERWMQRVAAEMNLSETAFVERRDGVFALRWFTPKTEVGLCGHATLATAHVLWETGWLDVDTPARFETRSGMLVAERRPDGIELDLPAIPVTDAQAPAPVIGALRVRPIYVGGTPERDLDDRDLLIHVDSEAIVRGLAPDHDVLRQHHVGVIVTARASTPGFHFVSRYFAPWWGIDEDPVTGVAHCSLAGYWSRRLGRASLVGYQASARGGVVHTRLDGDRVRLSGPAVTVLRGWLAC
jgi:predicted PhzF superfamily epimerase YddE/YHI9